MACLVDTGEAEVAVFTCLAILNTVNHHGYVARGVELLGMRVLSCQRDSFATKPVADVVCVAVDKSHSHTGVEEVFQVRHEVRVHKVASLLESEVDFVVREASVIGIDTKSVLCRCVVEERYDVVRWRRVIIWMADVVDATATEEVVRRLDVVTAHVGCFGADCLTIQGGGVDLFASLDLFETAVGHVASKLHVVVDGVVDRLYAVCIVNSEFRVVRCLDVFIDDTIDYAKRIEIERFSSLGPVLDGSILIVEVLEECGSIVTTVGLCHEVEVCGLDFAIELRQERVEALDDFPCSHGSKVGRV